MSLRPAYMVLSPRSLAYARLAIESLLAHSADALDLHLITDSADDRAELETALADIAPESRHRCHVHAEQDLAEREQERFAAYPWLRTLCHGHPCWRKVTDPLLLNERGDEMILLDPDLYFPNRFRFEPTPAKGLLLMWQQPNCLLPDATVRRALEGGVRLARHVDIGVAQWRTPTADDLAWLNDALATLAGGDDLPRKMHVEAIVWAALAMRLGGGYLDPARWTCWHRTQARRVQLKLGAKGRSMLAQESWPTLKCFHGGGEAKWWLPEFARHPTPTVDLSALSPSPVLPFVELTRERYGREQTVKSLVGKLGYYKLFGAGS